MHIHKIVHTQVEQILKKNNLMIIMLTNVLYE